MNKKSPTFYCEKIKQSPGGFDYFYSWVKFTSSIRDKTTNPISHLTSETQRILIVYNYFNGGGYNGGNMSPKPSQKSEVTFCNLVKIYFSENTNSTIENEINKRNELIEIIRGYYKRIKNSKGSYFHFYGWLRATYGLTHKGLNEPFVKRRIFDESFIKRTYIDDYQKFYNVFLKIANAYFSNTEENNYQFLVENIPEELLFIFQQYFIYFNEYVKNTKNELIDVTISKANRGLKFDFQTNESEQIERIKSYFSEYVEFAKKAVIQQVPTKELVENIKAEEFAKIQLESQISHLQLSLRIKETEVKYLEKENTFLKELAITISKKDNVIHNQYIQDGNQQFANQIQNKKNENK